MDLSRPATAIDVEGQVILGESVLLPSFGTDPRNIGYCNLLYAYHRDPEWCHVKVRLDPTSGTLWITPYNPLSQNQRFAAFSGQNTRPYYLKKIVVSKTAWKEWKDEYKKFERSRLRTMPGSDIKTDSNDLFVKTDNKTAMADIVDNFLNEVSETTSNDANENSNSVADSHVNETRSISTYEVLTPESSPVPSNNNLHLEERVTLIDWPPVGAVATPRALPTPDSSSPHTVYGPIKLPFCLEHISGYDPHALARDSFVSGLIKKEYLDGRTVDIGDGIRVCTLHFTEQLQRIAHRRSTVRMLLFEHECFRDAMAEETINAIAREEVNASRGNDELRELQLKVRRHFINHIREFSVDQVKRLTFDSGEPNLELVEGYAFYIVSPDPDILTQHLDFID